MTADITDIREEIAAELEATKEERRIAEMRKRDEAIRAAHVASNKKWAEKFSHYVQAPNTSAIDENGHLYINGVDVWYWVEFNPEYRKTSSWRSTPTGKMRICVGGYGDRTSYPERKDGTHNYGAIVERLINMANEKRRQIRANSVRKTNENFVEELKKSLRVQRYGSFDMSGSAYGDKPVYVNFTIKQCMTEEEASKLFRTMVELGYAKLEKDPA